MVLVDLPPSKEILVRLFSREKSARIYAYFYKEDSDFFRRSRQEIILNGIMPFS